jgi:tetratricopeptide (TPR) repeat protein
MKIERNETCICGSGKKNKICCNLKDIDDEKIIEKLYKISEKSLSFNENLLIESINELESFLTYSHLSNNNKRQVKLNLSSAFQKRGLHNKALNLISEIEKEKIKIDSHLYNYLIQLKAKSLTAIEKFEEATIELDKVIESLLSAIDNKEGAGLLLVEASKIYINGGEIKKAEKCLDKSILILKNDEKEREHFERAKANKAILMLHSENENTIKEGLKQLNDSIYAKCEIGDLEGLGTNYCNLGLHYWRKKDFKGAIAYLRKDLWITRKIGDLHGVAISLRNLTSLYVVLKQYKKAKILAKESIEIGQTINNQAIIESAKFQFEQAIELAKQAGIAKEPFGDKCLCVCESSKKFEDCCGEADHEPIEFPFRFEGMSEEVKENNSIQTSRLDFIFRDSDMAKTRLSWQNIEIKNGWYKLSELPDMANMYLLSAKNILEKINENDDNFHNPLSCLILSVSALEAYINQVAYFLDDIKNFPESNLHNIPDEFNSGVLDFQRNTELTLKWSILGTCICEEKWTPNPDIWNNFKSLISIRNEFIHFKSSEYEQVIPSPKTIHPILKKLPKSVETRKVFHSWPMRVLTPSLAQWSVNTAEEMIGYFKEQYKEKRINSA